MTAPQDIQTPYGNPIGGLPDQNFPVTSRATFTSAYAYIPGSCLRDIVTSRLPGWDETRLWILASPMSGFSTTFSYYIVEVDPGGGSERPDNDPRAEAILFVTEGEFELVLGTSGTHRITRGSYVYLAPGEEWELHNRSLNTAVFHWIRKIYQPACGHDAPDSFISHEDDIQHLRMHVDSDIWLTKRFVSVEDLAHDMHVNIITFQPGGCIPFMETHVMEHGLFVLEGKALYRLNQDWVEVTAGDFMWLRAFCPQACYAVGNVPFRYLLYKNVNRHSSLDIAPA